jgi:predicted metal-binding membrane protein
MYSDCSMADPPIDGERPPTILELALRQDRTPVVVLLVLLPLVSWMWIVVMARDMYGPMRGASAWTMTDRWDVPHLLLLCAMWAVMMVAMMLPSASPLVITYGVIARRATRSSASSQIYSLAAGYLLVWTLFSIAATGLQRLLAALMVLSAKMQTTNRVAAAILICIAGVYQLTPLKRRCLQMCESPLAFLMSRWRSGVRAAFAMGLEHGAYCLGCCWGLMLLLFVGGVMNLTVIAAVTAFVAFEKLSPCGVKSARISGLLLIMSAIWIVIR